MSSDAIEKMRSAVAGCDRFRGPIPIPAEVLVDAARQVLVEHDWTTAIVRYPQAPAYDRRGALQPGGSAVTTSDEPERIEPPR